MITLFTILSMLNWGTIELPFLTDLGTSIKTEIETGLWVDGDPKGDTFNTCLDWHSAVHCHWALLKLARTDKSFKDHGFWVNERLNARRFQNEKDAFERRPNRFEMPYGRAWFLLLAEEFSGWAKENQIFDHDRLIEWADEIAESLFSHFRTGSIGFHQKEYQNSSWALYRLVRYYRFKGNYAKIEFIRQRVISQFSQKLPDISYEYDFSRHKKQYFSPFGNTILLLHELELNNEIQRLLASSSFRPSQLRTPDSSYFRSVGQIWNRLWSFQVLRKYVEDSAPVDKAIKAHWNAGKSAHSIMKGDWLYSHWIPQFAVYGTLVRP